MGKKLGEATVGLRLRLKMGFSFILPIVKALLLEVAFLFRCWVTPTIS